MSSDEQNINEVEYSDDSDYEHRDSVLSTGHRNSVANRNSLVNRQSKRMSYGRKHNESKIEEILNKVQQEATVVIHQTESHIVESNILANNEQQQLVNEQQHLKQLPIKTEQETTEQPEQSTINQSSMFVSMNESQNQSEVFEVMEMSQSMSQSMSQAQEGEESKVEEPQGQSPKENNQDDELDYLPEEPYQVTHREEQVTTEQTNENSYQSNEQRASQQAQQEAQQPTSQTTQQNQAEHQQEQPQPQQLRSSPQQPTHQQFPQNSRSRSASNHSQQRKPSQELMPDQITKHYSHNLGDEFNNQENDNEDEIIQSFRDSTEEKRRNRVPGNSQLEYGDQINLEHHENIVDEEQNVIYEHHAGEKQDHFHQEENHQKPLENEEIEIKNEEIEIKNEEIEIQVTYESKKEQNESVEDIPTQQIATEQTTLQHQREQQQVEGPFQKEHELIISSQDVDQAEQNHSQPTHQEPIHSQPTQQDKTDQEPSGKADQKPSQQEAPYQSEQVAEIAARTLQEQSQQHPQTIQTQTSEVAQQVNQIADQYHRQPVTEKHQEIKEVDQPYTQQQNRHYQPSNQQNQHYDQQIDGNSHQEQPEEPEWPVTYGQQQLFNQNQTLSQPQNLTEAQIHQQYQKYQRTESKEQERHQQIESIISQPNQIQSSSSQQDQPINQLDQRIPTSTSPSQNSQIYSQILTSQIQTSHHTSSQQTQQQSGFVSIVSHTSQRQTHQLSQPQPQSAVFQKFSAIEVDFSKNGSSQVVQSQILESYSKNAEVSELKSEREPSSIIYEQNDEGGLKESVNQEGVNDQRKDVNQSSDEEQEQQQQKSFEKQFVPPVQNASQSQFIKIEQANSSFAQSESNARLIQSQIPPHAIHETQPSESKPSQPQPVIMTRVQSSQYLPEPLPKPSPEIKRKDIEASEYFVADKNLSSLDILGRSEYNQLLQPAQLGSEQSLSERETIQPHPLKSQLLKEAEKVAEVPPIQQEPRQHRKPTAPQPLEPQQPPKLQESQENIRNSVSNADLIISTSQVATSKKAKKEKAGSKHQERVQNPNSCNCIIF